ncbi:MAG TPA: cupin domain-containing protein [Thermoanaerobaculia bacterium]|nr:cupin domain-containing protein [Thermoanaerobaculia bacterium]
MRGRNILAFVVSLLLASVVLAQVGEGKAKAAPKAAAGKAVIWPATDLKWVDIEGGPAGVKVADLWGDHTKGAYGAMMKFPAGFAAPLHTHSSDAHLVIVSGTFIHGPEGKPEVRLPAGSYLKQPANYRHTTACDKASECVFFVEGKGKFDIKMVEEGKAPAKK